MEKRGDITEKTPNTENKSKIVVEVDLAQLDDDFHRRCANAVKCKLAENTNIDQEI